MTTARFTNAANLLIDVRKATQDLSDTERELQKAIDNVQKLQAKLADMVISQSLSIQKIFETDDLLQNKNPEFKAQLAEDINKAEEAKSSNSLSVITSAAEKHKKLLSQCNNVIFSLSDAPESLKVALSKAQAATNEVRALKNERAPRDEVKSAVAEFVKCREELLHMIRHHTAKILDDLKSYTLPADQIASLKKEGEDLINELNKPSLYIEVIQTLILEHSIFLHRYQSPESLSSTALIGKTFVIEKPSQPESAKTAETALDVAGKSEELSTVAKQTAEVSENVDNVDVSARRRFACRQS